MEPKFCSHVLTEVWEALEQVRPARGEFSLTDQGFVTAASTDGSVVRILLRLPAGLWRESGGRDLLGDVKEALSEVPALRDVRLDTKVYRLTLNREPCSKLPSHVLSAVPAWTSVPGSSDGHSACVGRALSDLRDRGWEIEGFQQLRHMATWDETVDQTDIVRVTIHARVEPTPSDTHLADSPLETA